MRITPRIKAMMKPGSVIARVIVEVIGKPRSFVDESIAAEIKQVKTLETSRLLKKRVFKTKKKKTFYSGFAELTLLFDDIRSMMDFCFDYMPSSIEVIEPGTVAVQEVELSNFLNDVLARLHNMDMIIKTTKTESRILNETSRRLLLNLVILSLRKGPKSLDQISAEVGVPAAQLSNFLPLFVRNRQIRKEGDNYLLPQTSQ
ncbi:hypothetical protein COT48_01545 [Candidatus Woesearchaeota archaeon CG08_land_8_20_14_0_20_47_9]|nr:MAG: hypothetical protein AUJ69_04555 [Candidatus Woesearchaeota archaeon CG1_02_47_18]PIO04220.1 MAG: hypothetical protein COT48_01545 [Candidatus Woesearchaeota archaeon CG08_land_8_20_14_0_20_47_9]HII29803.1 hypothetical protein [Candidatus Woesearchaeota archaeon]